VIKKYCKFNGGLFYVIAVVATLIIWEMVRMGSNVWISKWTANSKSGNNAPFLIGYGALAFMYGFFAMLRAGALLSGSVRASRSIHRRMISSLLFAPLNEFFERIPIGRILNRLSKDV
jgi:ABC-type multidrug transport system fused ATPase/permease subunit